MARTELPNGVILPAEYSDDWYEDMTSNLTKLDDVIGSDLEKLNADGVYFLRMSSAALTDSGTGNFSDLNSSYKIKTGDLVLDSGRKLYRIVSVDSTNETFTVGNSLFKVTAESDLAPVAESGDYGDLDNRPDLNPYDQHLANTDIHVTAADKTKWNNGVTQAYVLRYSSTAITDNSTIAYSTLDNTDNIKVSDKIIDSDGKIFSIVSIDSANETVTVGSALIDLALDANVMHLSGDETCTGNKGFVDNIIAKKIVSNVAQLQINARSNADSVAIIAGASASEGGGVWLYGKNSVNNSHVAIQVYDTNNSTFHAVRLNMDGALTPTVSNNGLGSNSFKWVGFNGINPGALSLPDLSNGIDISGYIDVNTTSEYTSLSNGYISICGTASATNAIAIKDKNFDYAVMGRSMTISSVATTYVLIPILSNHTYEIICSAVSSIVWAKFYPCLGNV